MYLGIEIGGTKLQAGLGRGDGVLAARWRSEVERNSGAAGILRQLQSAIPGFLADAGTDLADVSAIGIGFGGPIDDANRSALKSHQIGGWDGFRLADWAEDRFGRPCVVGNDADVAGLAEARIGAARGLSPVFYITIGSGIGGGLIIDGRIYRGVGRGAGEIGHCRIRDGAAAPVLEACCSGWAIERAWTERAGEAVACRELADRARRGDIAVRDFLHERWGWLADAVARIVALVCPRRIVIGGGVALMGDDVLFHPLRRLVAERVFAPFADCFEIVPAALGEKVVVHGAIALAAG